MGSDQALELMDRLLWNSLIVSAPVLIAALVVGLIVSVLQVATQLQESTLSYVPKLLVAAFVFLTVGPWMLGRITAFALYTLKLIPTLG